MAGIDTKTLAVAQQYAENLTAGFQSGVDSTTVSGQTITFNFKNGTSASITFPTPSNGKDGADGITPHIGENGNWYIGDIDTGVNARGDIDADAIQTAVCEYFKKNPVSGVTSDYVDEKIRLAIGGALDVSY